MSQSGCDSIITWNESRISDRVKGTRVFAVSCILTMNDDNDEQKASLRTQHRTRHPPPNLFTGIPAFSNPFTKIALEASYASDSPSRAPNPGTTVRQNIQAPSKMDADTTGSKHVRFESPTKVQTPQKRRPFQPLNANPNSNSKTRGETASSLSPYVNFLNGSQSSSSSLALLPPMSGPGFRVMQNSSLPSSHHLSASFGSLT
jgi:hypothetical protein